MPGTSLQPCRVTGRDSQLPGGGCGGSRGNAEEASWDSCGAWRHSRGSWKLPEAAGDPHCASLRSEGGCCGQGLWSAARPPGRQLACGSQTCIMAQGLVSTCSLAVLAGELDMPVLRRSAQPRDCSSLCSCTGFVSTWCRQALPTRCCNQTDKRMLLHALLYSKLAELTAGVPGRASPDAYLGPDGG